MTEKGTYGPHKAWYTTVNSGRLTVGNKSVNLPEYLASIKEKLGAKSVSTEPTTVVGMNGAIFTDAVWVLYEPSENQSD